MNSLRRCIESGARDDAMMYTMDYKSPNCAVKVELDIVDIVVETTFHRGARQSWLYYRCHHPELEKAERALNL